MIQSNFLRAYRTISIHAPARGATSPKIDMDAIRKISIHAPARGATTEREKGKRGERISIHAPARGATVSGPTPNCFHRFQSTHPRGVRPKTIQRNSTRQSISIHAPARGATRLRGIFPAHRPDFNPRTREGCDSNFYQIFHFSYSFFTNPPFIFLIPMMLFFLIHTPEHFFVYFSSANLPGIFCMLTIRTRKIVL